MFELIIHSCKHTQNCVVIYYIILYCVLERRLIFESKQTCFCFTGRQCTFVNKYLDYLHNFAAPTPMLCLYMALETIDFIFQQKNGQILYAVQCILLKKQINLSIENKNIERDSKVE